MALQTTTNINVDFCDKKYILINAKRLDKNSRFIYVTCYNHGEPYLLNSGEHSAYIRYKKPDNYSVFNFCDINYKGEVVIELTEQMLASDGISYADLVIVNRGNAVVDEKTGEIVAINNTAVLSTMTFCIDVSEIPVENTEIESTYNYDGLNELLERAETEYSQVVRMARSYAIGDADGIRENENTDNAKYYANLAHNDRLGASDFASKASASATNAATSEIKAATSETNASIYATNAANSASASAASANASATSAGAAATSEANAKNSMDSASDSANNASTHASNAEYYYTKMSEIMNEYNGVFLPMGTIEFSELATLVSNGTVKGGFLYNISNSFVTDNTFKEGAGIEYAAGANVYFTMDGYWDCLAGATVVGVKGDNETNYRIGSVNITADNVGAIPVTDIATVDEVKSYLGIE